MKNGYISKSEEAALVRAAEILNKYVDWAEEKGIRYSVEPPAKYARRAEHIEAACGRAATAAGSIYEFILVHEYED